MSFVDETRYRGTCYRACGFEALGPTAGFARASRDFYCEHGQPKQLYVRALRPGVRTLLRRGRLPGDLAAHEEKISGPCPFRAGELGSLLERFRTLADARRGHGLRHRQPVVLACAAVATLLGHCGYQAFEDACKKFTQRQLKALGCHQDDDGRYVAPSDTTFFRVLSQLDPAAFSARVGEWFLEQDPSVLARLAVDGKVLRGSGRGDGQPLQLLSAVSHRLRLTLAQVPIAEKSNEIPALQPLLRKLPALAGSLITADALHCQQASARCITQELGGDYLFGLKGNQSGVLERAERLLAQEAFPPDEAVAWEKGHGRLDRRRLKRVAVTPEELGLCGCWQVIAVRRERIELGPKAGPPTDAVSYYAASLTVAERSDTELLAVIRGHWDAIENGTHYRPRREPRGRRLRGVATRGGASAGNAAQPGVGPAGTGGRTRRTDRAKRQVGLPANDRWARPLLAAPMNAPEPVCQRGRRVAARPASRARAPPGPTGDPSG